MVLVLGIWQTKGLENSGVFLGPSRVSLQERDVTAEGVRIERFRLDHRGHSLVRCAVQHLCSHSASEKEILQHHRDRKP